MNHRLLSFCRVLRLQCRNPVILRGAHTTQVRNLRIFNIAHGRLTNDVAYPPPAASPNVPARSLGDVRDRGLAAWFNMSVINKSTLHRVLESQPERTDDWHPVHLRGRIVPPPPPPIYGDVRPPLMKTRKRCTL